MYLPLIAVMTAVGAATYLALARQSYVAMAAAIFAFGWLAHDRNRDFRSDLGIWQDTTAKQPVNERAWVFLSEALKARGKQVEAIDALLTGVRHRPTSAELQNNAGVAFFSAARTAEAIGHFEAAIRLKPEYAEAYYNLGIVHFRANNFQAASECFHRQIQLKPGSGEAHNYLGLCYLQLGKPAAAIPQFQRAVELEPTHRDARANLEAVKNLRR